MSWHQLLVCQLGRETPAPPEHFPSGASAFFLLPAASAPHEALQPLSRATPTLLSRGDFPERFVTAGGGCDTSTAARGFCESSGTPRTAS